MSKIFIIILTLVCTSCSVGYYYEFDRVSKNHSEIVFEDEVLRVSFIGLNDHSIQLMFSLNQPAERLRLDVRDIHLVLSVLGKEIEPQRSTFEKGVYILNVDEPFIMVENFNVLDAPKVMRVKLNFDIDYNGKEINKYYEATLSKVNYGYWEATKGI